MTAQDTKINLLPRDPFEDSVMGKFLKWALSMGRYIVIATELVVILSFLARFKFDRDLTDLNESIAEKQAILNSYRQVEADYRSVATRLTTIESVQQQSLKGTEALQKLSEVTPFDVSFSLVNVAADKVEVQGTALSEQGLTTFLNKLKNDSLWQDIAITQVSSNGEKGPGISFHLSAAAKAAATKKK